MKMPRSHFENDNVQFVQELAEVDGPFESPININFRDMTKLELPPLAWNRSDTLPKKMKITNTGHTVIISGKWKSERPYLTGGPLTGKYVFSQIHFHWGQDYTRGSEHQVSGEGFPLEMHVAHFKTEYLTQECALREKDGMVVVVYLFKLQEEPNNSLKKIINLLPCVKQASTSHAIDPQPILSLCNPFTDDYFMYWGSVVTSTCAHILMWVICREPFGISREQVDEFRKLMDSCQQPIARNSRDIQPLHKRNVFHVNASNYLDDPLLPIKKQAGCKCKKSEDNVSFQLSTDCTCQHSSQIQEDVEGSITEYLPRSDCVSTEGMQASNEKASLFSGCFPNQNIVVQTATVHSLSIVLKRFDSDPVDHSSPDNLKPNKSQNDSRKLTSQSCCFFSTSDIPDIKADKRKIRDRKRPFNSLRAFSQIISSLEALKTHTFKKLKEIESINQEIKGIKPIFHDAEDKQWLRKIEKMMSKKKEFTINTSHGYLRELKKLARECNFDKFFDSKTLHETENDEKMMWPPGHESASAKAQANLKKGEVPTQRGSNSKIKIPEKAQKLIQSFFEDIKDTDDLQESVKNDNPINLSNAQAGDSNSVSSVGRGYITQNMFKLGNLGDRFFTEVTSEDTDMNKEQWEGEKTSEKLSEKLQVLKELDELKKATWSKESQKLATSEDPEPEKVMTEPRREPVIPLHRANVPIAISKGTITQSETLEDFFQDSHLTEGERRFPSLESLPDRRHVYRHKRSDRPSSRKTYDKIYQKKLINRRNREFFSYADERFMRALEGKAGLQEIQISSPNLSTDSMDTHSMIIAKFRGKPSSKDFWPFNKSSVSRFADISPKRYGKISCKKFEGFYIEKKNIKNKKRKRQKRRTWHTISSIKDWKALILNSKMKRAKFKLRLESTSNTTTEFDLEKPISPERKKLRLENIRVRPGKTIFFSDDEPAEEETKRQLRNDLPGRYEIRLTTPEKETVGEKACGASTNSEGYSSRERRRDVMTCEDSFKTPTSARSVKNLSEQQEKTPSETFKVSPKRETLKAEDQIWSKPIPKNKSLSNMVVTQRRSAEFSQRLHTEYLDCRRKNSNENSGLRSKKQSKENYKVQSVKNLYRGISNETYRKSDAEHDHEEKVLVESKDVADTLSSGKLKYSIGFLTTSSQVDDELLPKDPNQEGATKNVFLKRCDAEKYLFLEKVPQEISLPFKDHNDLFSEILHQTDSNKSFGTSKGDAESTNMGNVDLQTSVTYTTLRKNASRPHSAETLSFLMKTIKRKYKKRPHCCKRNSIHYIRKNSSKKFEEVVFRKASQENEKRTLKDSHSLMLKDASQEEVSLPESSEKEVKNISHESKRNAKTSKFQNEAKKDKIQRPVTAVKKPAADTTKPTATSPKPAGPIAKPVLAIPKPVAATHKPAPTFKKPVNNFIKLNKELAGKYKRRMVNTTRNTEKQEAPTKTKLPTPQPLKLPQRKRGKITVRKPDFLVHPSLQTTLPTNTKAYKQKPSPRGLKAKTPRAKRVKSLGCVKFDRISRSQTFAFRAPFYSE